MLSYIYICFFFQKDLDAYWEAAKSSFFNCRAIKALPPHLELIGRRIFFVLSSILFSLMVGPLPPPRLNCTVIKKFLFVLRLP